MKKITRRSIILSTAGLLAAPHIARAAPRPVRLGHNNTDESQYGQGATAFAQAVAADPDLAGALALTVYGASKLGNDLGMLKDLTSGTLDLLLCAGSLTSNIAPELGLLTVPFLFRDVGQARQVLQGPVGAEFADLLRAKGVALLAWGETGLRHVTANRPVRNPAELHGLKLRVPQSEVMLAGFRALGADAGSLSFSLFLEALRAGQFEAQENPLTNIESYKLYDVQSDLSLTGHIYDPAVFMASADLVEDLTPAQRTALAGCAAKGAAVTRQYAEATARDAVARLKGHGMKIHDDIDRDGFAAAARPFVESLGAKFGVERIQRLLAAVG